MAVFFVTRHEQAVLWAAQNGLHAANLQHRHHLDLTEVEPGDVVFGTLPLHLAADLCAIGCRYVHLIVQFDPAARGRELTHEEMDQRASLQEFDVRALPCPPAGELLPVQLFVARHETTQLWGMESGLIDEQTRIIADLDVEADVNLGDVVAGTLPPNVVALINHKGARYLHLGIEMRREERGTTLPESELQARGFEVNEINVRPVLKRTDHLLPADPQDQRRVFMVCIASGQNLPNVIPCAEYPLAGLLILVTDSERSWTSAKRIAAALKYLDYQDGALPTVHYHKYIPLSDAVGEASLYRSLQQLKKTYGGLHPDCRFIVNLTGGTKPMSFELSHLAERLGFERIYCETEQSAIRVFDHRQSVRYSALQPFHANLSIQAYFQAQGYCVLGALDNPTDILHPTGQVMPAEQKKMHSFALTMLDKAHEMIPTWQANPNVPRASSKSGEPASGWRYHAMIHQLGNGFFTVNRQKKPNREEFVANQVINFSDDNSRTLSRALSISYPLNRFLVNSLTKLGLTFTKDTQGKVTEIHCPNEIIGRFLRGAWFEYSFATTLEQALQDLLGKLKSSPVVRYNVRLDYAESPAKGILVKAPELDKQELDVALLYGNRLHVFELKAGWSFLYESKGTDYKGLALKNSIAGALGTYQLVVPSASGPEEKAKSSYKRLKQFDLPVHEFAADPASFQAFTNWVREQVLAPLLLR